MPRPARKVKAPTIGDRIRDARKAVGWTQGDLARALGLSVQRISQVETGDQAGGTLTFEWLSRCAAALGVPLRQLAPELVREADPEGSPAVELTLVPATATGAAAGHWVPRSPDDDALAKRIGGGFAQPLGDLLARCAAAKVSLRFRGDLPARKGAG